MTPNPTPSPLRIGIDIGGTFTDFVIFDPTTGRVETFKLLSTPNDPAEAVMEGLQRISNQYSVGQSTDPPNTDPLTTDHCSLITDHWTLIHGSTVATNALLERKGARMVFVATQGFGDILQIGRQNRPALYDWAAQPPAPLAPAELRLEVDERTGAHGEILVPLAPSALSSLLSALRSLSPESVALCLLFSFANPAHEQAIAAALRAAGYFVSASHEILPEYREYERASTTAVNAYVSPILDRYLSRLQQSAVSGQRSAWRILQSNGGAISLDEARRAGVRCILSGPAGGVNGARYVAALAAAPGERARVISFDMGGTSTDVSLIDGEPKVTGEAIVGGCPIRIPVLDIHTIGAGGGSIAWVDAGGALRVGPQSAGADPGPACYGRGDPRRGVPTVTDANLVLGRLAADWFLGGQMPLDAGRARAALQTLGAPLGLSAEQTALGVVEIANAHMERAIRVISVKRGHDPADFTLLSFGGAGGLHAADLARRVGARGVLVPPLASTLSAFGMLAADVVKDYSQTVMLPGDAPFGQLQAAFSPMLERGQAELHAEGIAAGDERLEALLDMRYRGQSYELTVPFSAAFLTDFHAAHHGAYGYDRPQTPVEIVTLRVRAVGKVTPPGLAAQPLGDSDPRRSRLYGRPVILADGDTVPVSFYRAEGLTPGNVIPGPAVVLRADTTIYFGPDDEAVVDGYCNLIIKTSEVFNTSEV